MLAHRKYLAHRDWDTGSRNLSYDVSFRFENGFSIPEGPFLEHGLEKEFVWITSRTARVFFFTDTSCRRSLRIDLRNPFPGQELTFWYRDEDVYHIKLQPNSLSNSIYIDFKIFITSGISCMTIEIQKLITDKNRDLGVLIYDFQVFSPIKKAQIGETNPSIVQPEAWEAKSSVYDSEGPFPEFNLHQAIRWTKGYSSVVAIRSDRRGRRILQLHFRSGVVGQRIGWLLESGSSGLSNGTRGDINIDEVCEIVGWFEEGWQDIQLTVDIIMPVERELGIAILYFSFVEPGIDLNVHAGTS